MYIQIYIYIPRTQMTIILIGKGLVLGGWPSKIEVIWVPGIYIYMYTLYHDMKTIATVFWGVQGHPSKLFQQPCCNLKIHISEGSALSINYVYMGVSKNRGTPKSFILIGVSIVNHPFWGTPIFGNTHIYVCIEKTAYYVPGTLFFLDFWR